MAKPLFEGCIFDLDGVIVDTAKYHFLSWNKLARNLGFEIKEEDNEQLKGISRVDSLEIVLKIGNYTLPQKEKLKCLKSKNDYYLEYVQKLTAKDALPGVEEFLQELKKESYKISLGSASANARGIIDKLNFTQYFHAIVDGTDVQKSKPHPEVFLRASALLQIDPKKIVVFEDAQKGIKAAHSAGCLAVGVGDPEVLSEADINIKGFKGYSMNDLIRSLSELAAK